MPLSLTKRIPTGAPLSAVQNDANMTAIENAVNANTTSISTINAGSGSIYTKAQVDALIAGIPAPTAFNSNPSAQVASGQSDAPNGSNYTIAGISYSAPATGVYMISAVGQFDGSGVSGSTMQILLFPAVNGAPASQGTGVNTPLSASGRWFASFSVMVTLSAGDAVTLQYQPSDGVGAGTLTVANTYMNIFRLST